MTHLIKNHHLTSFALVPNLAIVSKVSKQSLTNSITVESTPRIRPRKRATTEDGISRRPKRHIVLPDPNYEIELKSPPPTPQAPAEEPAESSLPQRRESGSWRDRRRKKSSPETVELPPPTGERVPSRRKSIREKLRQRPPSAPPDILAAPLPLPPPQEPERRPSRRASISFLMQRKRIL